jgi:D-alanine-D-alanine ligase
MRVMVLCGGPDRERGVSLHSGAQVAAALAAAGHGVIVRDLGPGDTAALDEFEGDVVFPVFHGKWGEGGPCQALLAARGRPFVGCREAAARLCFDKAATKRALIEAGVPTPAFALVGTAGTPGGQELREQLGALDVPVVVKPNDEGSSIDLRLCRDAAALKTAWAELAPRHETLLVEQLVTGREMTVGVIVDEAGRPTALPSIQIVPATAFYDYQAKYERDDTRYLFDTLDAELEQRMRELAVRVFEVLGCRHLARVDLFVDAEDRPWVIEVNTLPGFTDHSLLPMAAARARLAMPALVDRLVLQAAAG